MNETKMKAQISVSCARLLRITGDTYLLRRLGGEELLQKVESGDDDDDLARDGNHHDELSNLRFNLANDRNFNADTAQQFQRVSAEAIHNAPPSGSPKVHPNPERSDSSSRFKVIARNKNDKADDSSNEDDTTVPHCHQANAVARTENGPAAPAVGQTQPTTIESTGSFEDVPIHWSISSLSNAKLKDMFRAEISDTHIRWKLLLIFCIMGILNTVIHIYLHRQLRAVLIDKILRKNHIDTGEISSCGPVRDRWLEEARKRAMETQGVSNASDVHLTADDLYTCNVPPSVFRFLVLRCVHAVFDTTPVLESETFDNPGPRSTDHWTSDLGLSFPAILCAIHELSNYASSALILLWVFLTFGGIPDGAGGSSVKVVGDQTTEGGEQILLQNSEFNSGEMEVVMKNSVNSDRKDTKLGDGSRELGGDGNATNMASIIDAVSREFHDDGPLDGNMKTLRSGSPDEGSSNFVGGSNFVGDDGTIPKTLGERSGNFASFTSSSTLVFLRKAKSVVTNKVSHKVTSHYKLSRYTSESNQTSYGIVLVYFTVARFLFMHELYMGFRACQFIFLLLIYLRNFVPLMQQGNGWGSHQQLHKYKVLDDEVIGDEYRAWDRSLLDDDDLDQAFEDGDPIVDPITDGGMTTGDILNKNLTDDVDVSDSQGRVVTKTGAPKNKGFKNTGRDPTRVPKFLLYVRRYTILQEIAFSPLVISGNRKIMSMCAVFVLLLDIVLIIAEKKVYNDKTKSKSAFVKAIAETESDSESKETKRAALKASFRASGQAFSKPKKNPASAASVVPLSNIKGAVSDDGKTDNRYHNALQSQNSPNMRRTTGDPSMRICYVNLVLLAVCRVTYLIGHQFMLYNVIFSNVISKLWTTGTKILWANAFLILWSNFLSRLWFTAFRERQTIVVLVIVFITFFYAELINSFLIFRLSGEGSILDILIGMIGFLGVNAYKETLMWIHWDIFTREKSFLNRLPFMNQYYEQMVLNSEDPFGDPLFSEDSREWSRDSYKNLEKNFEDLKALYAIYIWNIRHSYVVDMSYPVILCCVLAEVIMRTLHGDTEKGSGFYLLANKKGTQSLLAPDREGHSENETSSENSLLRYLSLYILFAGASILQGRSLRNRNRKQLGRAIERILKLDEISKRSNKASNNRLLNRAGRPRDKRNDGGIRAARASELEERIEGNRLSNLEERDKRNQGDDPNEDERRMAENVSQEIRNIIWGEFFYILILLGGAALYMFSFSVTLFSVAVKL